MTNKNRNRIKAKATSLTALLASVLILSALAGAQFIGKSSAAIAYNEDTDYSLNGRGEVFIQGAPIRGSNGIYFDTNDRLHIASVYGNEIVVMDPDSGEILERINAPWPDDLTFGPDGSLYYTSFGTGYVYRIKPDGNITSQRVAFGVNPITFSSTGRLFVALDFYGDGLYEVDPELIEDPIKLNGATSLGYLNAMDFGPDGLLYGPIWTQARIVQINVTAVPFAMTTVCDEEIGIPAAVKFDSKGNLYMGDQLKGEVSRINVTTGHKEVIATGLVGLDNLAFDSQDRLFVSNAFDGSINEILSSGDKRLVSRGGMTIPGGVAVGTASYDGESVFVADTWGFQEYDALSGTAKGAVYNFLNWPSSIKAPETVSLDGDNLILASTSGVQLYNLQTGNHTTVSTRSALNAIMFKDQIVISQTSGVIWAGNSSSIADLNVATGLVAIGDDLYVAEKNSGVVWRIVSDGVPTKVQVAAGLSRPMGLAVDLNGDLLVVESGAGRVSRIKLATGNVSVVVDGLELARMRSTGSAFNGIAVGSTGYIYVSGARANVIYRLYPIQMLTGSSDWPMFGHDPQRTGYTESPAPNTNQTLWTSTLGGMAGTHPAVADGKLYVGSWDSLVYCFDAATGAQIWNYTTGGGIFSCPAVADGKVYVGSADDNVYCWDADTGTKIWNYTTGDEVVSSPVVANGNVYVGSKDSNVYCLSADSGLVEWTYTTGASIELSSPAVADGKVYIGSDDNKTYCLDAVNGDLIWSYLTGDMIQSSPTVADGRIYVGSCDDNVYCFDAANGERIWNYTAGGDIGYSSPAVAYGRVYVGSYDRDVYCLDAETGELIWNYTTGGQVWGSPTVADGKVYVGSYDRKFYCLDATDGALIWSYTTGGFVLDSPVVANGVAYAVSADRNVYAFSTWVPIPEGLTFGVMLLLSTVATIAGICILRKQPKWKRW